MSTQKDIESYEITQMINKISELQKQNSELTATGFELISEQTKLFSLLHNASDGIITFAADGTVENFNIAAQHIFGYSDSDTISRKIADLIPCPDWVHENVGAYIRYFIASRSSADIPLLARHRMGYDILLDVTISEANESDITLFGDSVAARDDTEITESHQEEQKIICFFRDITLNKKLETELKNHKLALDLAAGVIICNKDFLVIDVNDLFCQILKRNRDEFLGKNIQSILAKSPCYKLKQRKETLSQGEPWRGEACFLNKQNEKIWFTESTTAFLDKDNEAYQYLSIFVDTSEKKQFESQLKLHGARLQDLIDEQLIDIKYSRDIAERANEAKSEFLANISHELKTPIHGIISFTQLSLKQFQIIPFSKKELKKIQKFLTNIEISGERLLLLFNDLLDLSKLESGTVELHFARHDLFQLSQQIKDEFMAKIEENKINFILNQPTEPAILLCDKNKILQVLSNLIANAIKFTAENKSITLIIENTAIVLGKRAHDRKKTPGFILSIIDQGIGIPEDELNSIFDAFTQSSLTKNGSGGTGLGLAISYKIISAHQGKLWAEPNPEGGAIFKLFLPTISV